MQPCSPLLFVCVSFTTLKLCRRVSQSACPEVAKRLCRCFTITQRRKGKTCHELVAEASKGRFYKSGVMALSENMFSRDAITTLFIKCFAL